LIETQKTELVFPYSRSIESVFYFHPNSIVNIYRFVVSSTQEHNNNKRNYALLDSNTLVDGSTLQLLKKGYDIRLIRFDLANISAVRS